MCFEIYHTEAQADSDCQSQLFNFRRFGHEFFFNCALTCPSIEVYAFWYLPAYLIKFQILVYGSGVGLLQNISEVGSGAFIGFFVFYTLTGKDIKRFYQQQVILRREQALLKKESQLTQVLNNQTNAILVVNQEQIQAQADPNKIIEICNTKANNFFACGMDCSYSSSKYQNFLTPRFKQFRKNTQSLFEEFSMAEERQIESIHEHFKNQEDRVFTFMTDEKPLTSFFNPHKLKSLFDITKTQTPLQDGELEVYLMISHDPEDVTFEKDKLLLVHRTLISHNKVECQVLSFTDITSDRRLKQEQSRSKMLKMLNTSVHHEMLSPLRVNVLLAEQILNNLKSKKDSTLREMSQTIYVSSKLMLLHANDILDQSLIENGSFSPSFAKSSLPEAVLQMVKLVRLTLTQKKVVIQCNVQECRQQDPFVVFDCRRLQQVLLNLLTNAVKFQAEGIIQVTARITKSSNDRSKRMIEVEVRDEGIGMTEEESARIFQPFYTGSCQKRYNPNGIGVGLYICKKICESLGGSIQVQSEPGQGTTFVFLMEIQDSPSAYLSNEWSDPSYKQNQILTQKTQSNDQKVAVVQPQQEDVLFSWNDSNSTQGHSSILTLNGLKFDLNSDRTQPQGDSQAKNANKPLIKFLRNLAKHNVFDDKSFVGRIVFADDQFVNQQQMYLNFQQLNIGHKLKILENGQETVDYLSQVLDESKEVLPVTMLILDINMPILDGLGCIKQVKSLYQQKSKERDLIMPYTCFMSQVPFQVISQFITPEERADCLLEKPIPFDELVAMLKLLNVIDTRADSVCVETPN